jgi:hypothetical protein
MCAFGNRSCDEKGKVAEAGRTELIQAASTTVLAGVREKRVNSAGQVLG